MGVEFIVCVVLYITSTLYNKYCSYVYEIWMFYCLLYLDFTNLS